LYATRYAGGCRGGLCLREVSEVLEVLDTMRRVLFYMLEAAEGELCLLEVMRCMLLGMLEVMRCMRLGMLEAVEGGLCLREVLDVLDMMRCMLLAGCCGRRAQFQRFEISMWQFSRHSPPPTANNSRELGVTPLAVAN